MSKLEDEMNEIVGQTEHVSEKDVKTILEESMSEYAPEVILHRAIPDFRDGLKPVQRRLLWQTHLSKLTSDAKHMKLAKLSGLVLAYHPHACLDANTQFYLRSGETVTIGEMYDQTIVDPNTTYEVYAIDDNGSLVEAELSRARIGQITDVIYQITTSNGMTVETTGNHRFKLFDGSWVRADQLSVNDVLSQVQLSDDDYYTQAKLFNSSLKTSYDLFKMAKRNHPNSQTGDSDYECHHIDKNKRNNSTSNLVWLTKREHHLLHKDTCNEGYARGRNSMFGDDVDPEFRSLIAEKNSLLISEFNRQQGLFKAMQVVRLLEESDLPITNDNYEQNRSRIYNAPFIKTLKKRGYIDSDVSELSNVEFKVDVPESRGLTKKYRQERGLNEEHVGRQIVDASGYKVNAVQYRALTVAAKAMSTYGEVTEQTYMQSRRKLIDEGNGLTSNLYPVYDANMLTSILNDRMLEVVTSVKVIKMAKAKTMYDFTVENFENALICDPNDKNHLICVHNSGSIDGTAVGLSQSWDRRTPLIDIHGNNGSIDGLPAAASRYIEARQAPAARFLTQGLDRNAVDLIDNFDSTAVEPKVLPAAYPTAMTNGTTGMAIGFATSILPHNPIELLEASKMLVNHPESSAEEVANIVKGPDFPTGGVLVDSWQSAIDEAAGKSVTYTVRAAVNIVEDKFEPHLDIYQPPYGITLDKLMENMAGALNKCRSLGVVDFRNDSLDNENISIKVIFRKGTPVENMKKVEAYLYKRTKLEVKHSANNMMIVDGHPRYIGVKDYLLKFIEFRLKTLNRIWAFDLEKHRLDLEIVNAIIFAINNAEEVVKLAQESKDRADLESTLQTRFGELTARQAEYIAGMPVYRFSKRSDELPKLHDRRSNHESEMSRLDNLLTDESAAKAELLVDFDQTIAGLSEYTRKTSFVDSENVDDIVKSIDVVEEVIEDKQVEVVVSRPLSMRRLGVKAYENQSQSAAQSRDIVWHATASTKDFMAGITKDGKAIVRRIIDLEHVNLDVKTQPFNRDVKGLMSDDEFLTGLLFDDDDSKRLITVSDRGYVKVIEPSKLMPNTRTRGYMRKAWTVSGLKGGTDKLAFAKVFTLEEMNKIDLEITVQPTRGNQKVRVLKLKDLVDRSDSAGSSGARWVNTHDGEWRIDKIVEAEAE